MKTHNPDKPVPPSPDDPFEPIVESLLRYPLDSREFADAAAVAGPAEIAEARRQIDLQEGLVKERNRDVDGKLAHLREQYPELRRERDDDQD
jgi:hypothetical protein